MAEDVAQTASDPEVKPQWQEGGREGGREGMREDRWWLIQ
jgi:hypothetical protein